MNFYIGQCLCFAFKLKETNISTKHDRLKNPSWREADQLAIYNHDWELKQL